MLLRELESAPHGPSRIRAIALSEEQSWGAR
jgi:hypothetical protein